MSAKKRNRRNRNGYDPQDELAYEMNRTNAGNDDAPQPPSEANTTPEDCPRTEEPVDNALEDRPIPQGSISEEREQPGGASLPEDAEDESIRSQQEGGSLTPDVGSEDEVGALRKELATVQEKLARAEKKLSERKAEEDELLRREIELEESQAALLDRENRIREAEARRDSGYAAEKAAHDAKLLDDAQKAASEIEQRRAQAIAELDREYASIRAERLKAIDDAASLEVERVRGKLFLERKEWEEQKKRQGEAIAAKIAETEEQRGALDGQLGDIIRKSADLDLSQQGLDKQRESFNKYMASEYDAMEQIVDQRVEARREAFEIRERASEAERQRLLTQLTAQSSLLAALEALELRLGDRDLEEVFAGLDDREDNLTRLAESITSGEAYVRMQRRVDEAEARCKKSEDQIDRLNKAIEDSAQMALENGELKFKLQDAEQKRDNAIQLAEDARTEIARLSQELERHRKSYEKPEERNQRIAEIERPFFEAPEAVRPDFPDEAPMLSEVDWLNDVITSCEDYGLHFNPRLVKAFHTSLKTAEWSPLTVLAGVSGTGKSELPRLYAHFGGLYFMSVAVQPNWDSKESMLGFFNSIDNRFDAEPILRFFAQSQRDWLDPANDGDSYPGLSEAVCLVLLDEMNLAHPELYFAEFLSKLEQRRGIEWLEPECPKGFPKIGVKIGSGMDQHEIPLGRNLLWTGTMNQDETTKSLSDKVVDRSIILNFPRPTTLKRRVEIKALDSSNRGKPLHICTWDSWRVAKTDFDDEEIMPYKRFVEEMNDSLGVVGRAIGHRVWQSVEYYMANYPDVRLAKKNSDERRKAMHIAFEDQLVQKIMPKLRGIDTSGESARLCLSPIKNMLGEGVNGVPFHLQADFEQAMKLGYGQFVWQTANYLKESDSSVDSEI